MPFLFFIFLILISCSKDLFYNEPAPILSVEASFYRNSDEDKILRTKDTIAKGSSVQFQAKINPSTSNAKDFFWIINSQRYTLLQPKHDFKASGLYNARFYAIDYFGDTLTQDLHIAVSSKPDCNETIDIKNFQGSPTFSWICDDESKNLSYRFKLLDSSKRIAKDTTLQKNTLQLGFALPEDFEISLTASNGYFEYILSKWRIDE